MEHILYIAIGITIGAIVGWLLAKAKATATTQAEKEEAQQRFTALEKEYVSYKATTDLQLQTAATNFNAKAEEITGLKQMIDEHAKELFSTNSQLSTANANLQAANKAISEKSETIAALNEELKAAKAERDSANRFLATAEAENKSLAEKLQTQKGEIEQLRTQFNTEFENIANKILETKTEKFTALNRDNLTNILQPLGEKIQDFKKQVEDTYGKESNERASLKTELKGLIDLNQQLSSDAKNLTRALKAEVKTQGRWGEMILEKILEKSGLRKGEEFFMEHQLFGTDGKPLIGAMTGKKMRPDALIKYPDERHVIVDAKVSLNAFLRFTEAEEESVSQAELMAHVKAVKNHIDELSIRAYDDYDKSMDFVMMFIPNESAYFAAMQGDENLWEYAYDRRILLISPTNLISALKLISDLWTRERNDRNAMAIADRAVKMYEKMVGFVDSLDAIGKNLDQAKAKFDDASKQLHSGRDNFFSQASKMKLLLNGRNRKDFDQARLDMGEDGEIAAEPTEQQN